MVSRPLTRSARLARSVAVRVAAQIRRQFITRNRRMAFVLTIATLAIGGAGAVAARAADSLRPGRGHAGVRRAVRPRGSRHHRDGRGHGAVRRRAGPDPVEARRPGAARGPDADRAAGPDPGPGPAARAARGLAVRRGAPPGRGLVVRRRLPGLVL